MAQTPDREFLIAYDRGLLSLSVESIKVRRVLKAVAEKAGISSTWPKNLEKIVTVEFYNVLLEEGLRRILKDLSYALIYTPSGERTGAETVTRVYVCPEAYRSRWTSRRSSLPSTGLSLPGSIGWRRGRSAFSRKPQSSEEPFST